MRFLVFIMISTMLSFSVFAKNPERELYDQVVNNAQVCSQKADSGQHRINCWVNSAPEKCESIVLDMFHDRKNMTKHRNKLYLCVVTCVDAGFISRNFGRCSTKL